ncbi:Ycf49-like protein [Drosera capensis]
MHHWPKPSNIPSRTSNPPPAMSALSLSLPLPSRPFPLSQPLRRNPTRCCSTRTRRSLTGLATFGAGLVALTAMGAQCCPSAAAEVRVLEALEGSVSVGEPSNALSLPTWAVHVSSVAEWVIAMALVWQYGDRSGCEAWKGLSWGMVPLLGGAMCACTWHFFYNSESLEVLVAIQAALTVIGNATMCIAAFRIYQSNSRSGAP